VSVSVVCAAGTDGVFFSLLARLYSFHPPSSFHIYTPVRGQKRVRELSFDIDVIDQQINWELESLREEIETFLRKPEPPTWVPPDYVTPSHREFLTGLRIPCYKNGNPSLLFHRLDLCDDYGQIEEVFGPSVHKHVVINCSLNPSHHRLQVHLHLQHIWIGQNPAHDGRPH
jgi:hypothetical protein